MIQRMPLMNVRYATDGFNWLRRLNHQAKIGKLNRDGMCSSVAYSNFKMTSGLWVDWIPETQKIIPTEKNKKCCPPIVAIRRKKVWLFNTHRDVYYSLKCKKFVLNVLTPTKQGIEQDKTGDGS